VAKGSTLNIKTLINSLTCGNKEESVEGLGFCPESKFRLRLLLADSVSKSSFQGVPPGLSPKGNLGTEACISTSSGERQATGIISDFKHCVLYECNSSLELTYASSNASDLINVDCDPLIGTRSFWRERVYQEDVEWLSGKLIDCRASGSTSFIHRIVDDSGLPIWIVHCLCRVTTEESEFFRGCIVPICDEKRFHDLGHGPVSSFIHKIGNHIQLLTLLIGPLKKVLPESRDIEALQQTIEKTIELTRAFSDFSQRLSSSSEIDVCEVISSAISAKKAEFAEDRVAFQVAMESAMQGVSALGDPYLLESSIANILQNALEAITGNGQVAIEAKVENGNGRGSLVVVLRITDTGCGIRQEDLGKVTIPFFTTKKDHDGLGLSMASRFIDLHGGVLKVDSWLGKGTEVSITLPVSATKAVLDR
jgi:hypothetical protein